MIQLVVMMYVRYPLSLRNVEDLLVERGIDISYETIGYLTYIITGRRMICAELLKYRNGLPIA